jgi:hypothetical protein
MRLAVALCALGALAAPARASHRRYSGPMPPFRFELTLGAAQRSVGGELFSGSGHVPGVPDAQALVGRGDALGFAKPILFQASLHVLYGLRHFAFGGEVSGFWGGSDRPGSAQLTSLVGRSLSGYNAGPEIRTMWQRDWLEVSGVVALGYESLGVPITGFEKVSCGKGGRCYPTADASRFFLEPRAVVTIHLRSFILGAYGGGDVLPGGGFSAGGFIGLATEEWRKRATMQ